MTSFPILDLVACLIFIYFLLALINNSCIELYAEFIELRASMLKEWIKNTFDSAANGILDHVMLNSLSPKGRSTHYMNGKSFAKTVAEQVYAAVQTQAASGTSTVRVLDISNI